MDQDQMNKLLDRYLDGNTSNQENEFVESWLETRARPGDEWLQLDPADKTQYLSALYNELLFGIHQNEKGVVAIQSRRRLVRLSVPAAAAILLIVFAGYFTWPALQKKIYPVQLSTLNVPDHQKRQLTLADGSRVWVNAGSALRFPKSFSGNTREVFLNGEAYFDVVHDPDKPFIIHTGTVTTTVLGTAFNIKEDHQEHSISVTVARGKVRVNESGKLLGIITRNEQMSFNTRSAQAVRSTVNSDQVTAWQRSDLHFDDITFEQAVVSLEERFKVKIVFKNERLKNCRFSGTVLEAEELENILTTICAFNHASYSRSRDNSYLIEGSGCK